MADSCHMALSNLLINVKALEGLNAKRDLRVSMDATTKSISLLTCQSS
jgi:hypothetical protein